MSTAWIAGLVALLVGIGLTAWTWHAPVDVLRPAAATQFGSLPLPELDAGDDAVVRRRLGWQRRLSSLAWGPTLLCLAESALALSHGDAAGPRTVLWWGLALMFSVLPRLLDPAVARRVRSRRSTAPLRRRTLRGYLSPWVLASQMMVSLTMVLWSVLLLRQQHDGDTIACVGVEGALLGMCWATQIAILQAPAGVGTPPGTVWDEFLRSSALASTSGTLLNIPLMPIVFTFSPATGHQHVVMTLFIVSVAAGAISWFDDNDARRLRRVYAMLAGPAPDPAPRGQEAG